MIALRTCATTIKILFPIARPAFYHRPTSASAPFGKPRFGKALKGLLNDDTMRLYLTSVIIL